MCGIDTKILNDGLGLMLTGMGTVFSFLVVLWFAVSLMGKAVGKLNELFPVVTAQPAKAIAQKTDDIEIAIAIAMAKLKN